MNKGLCSALAALIFSFYCFSALAEVRQAHTLQDSALRAEPSASAASVGQVGNGSCDAQQAVIGACRQRETLHRRTEQAHDEAMAENRTGADALSSILPGL